MGVLTSITVLPPSLTDSVNNQETSTVRNLADVPLVAVGDVSCLRTGIGMAIPLDPREVAITEQRHCRNRAQRRPRRTITDKAVLTPNVSQIIFLTLFGCVFDGRADQKLFNVKESGQHLRRN